MTLVLSLFGRDSVWTLADRRLTNRRGVVLEDARKIMFLETSDGRATLAYAGLGATALGTEPADWMAAALRGRDQTLEESLGTLATALRREFPPHLQQLDIRGTPQHTVMAAGFLRGGSALYSIDLALDPAGKERFFRYTRHGNPPRLRPSRIAYAGSGGSVIHGNKRLRRELMRLVLAYEYGRVSRGTVADAFARVNHMVHRSLADGSVGPNCIVAWRPRSADARDGGGHYVYTGIDRDRDTPQLPTIARGMDVGAIANAILPHTVRVFEELLDGKSPVEPDRTKIDDALRQLPQGHDERLK
jgi:hypothetical protein